MEQILPIILPQARDAIIILGFIAIDIATGLIKAAALGNYTSETMRKGLFHKVAELLAFAFGLLADFTFPIIGVKLPVSVARSIAVYLCVMESGSITENIGQINPDIAKYLSGIFEKIKPASPDNEKPEEINEREADEE